MTRWAHNTYMDILFDIGGTKTRVAGTDGKGGFLSPVVAETPKRYEEGLAYLEQTIREIAGETPVRAVIGGVAGPYNAKLGKLVASPNLPDWVGRPIADDITRLINAPARVMNDAALVGLGEAVHGAGAGRDIVAYMTVSTGVGGARIVRGAIDAAEIGFEPGHQVVDIDGSLSFAPGERELERLVSGRAVEERVGKPPALIEDPSFWDSAADILAAGIANTIVYWSPSIVVLGGSMMNKIGVSPEKVKEYLPRYLTIYSELPPIVHSTLGDLGGIHGALVLSEER